MLEVKDHLNTVVEALEWENLNGSNNYLPKKPFAHQTNVTSSEKSTSIAMVVPVLKELELHLKKVWTYINTLPLISFLLATQTGIFTVLLKELENRFVYVLHPSSPTFDLAAALLNPA